MTFRSNKRLKVFLLVFALVIIAGIVVILLSNNGNWRDITSQQLTATTFKLGQQVKVLSGYATSVVLYPLAAGETQKDVLFCNLKPDGKPAYEPSAFKANMNKKAQCLSGYMEATKLREQSGVIQGNLGTVESILAAINMTKKELDDSPNSDFNLVVIPSGTFLPAPIQYASGIQMKCVVNASGGKSPEGIGTLQSLNAPTFKLSTPESVARFKALEKKVALILKRVQAMNADSNPITKAFTLALIIKDAIGLKSEAVSAGIPLSPVAVQKNYRSILASGPFAVVGMSFYRDEDGKRSSSNDSGSCEDTSAFVGSVGVEVGGQSFGFTNVCLTPDDLNKIPAMINQSQQSFFKMRTSLGSQLQANTAALKKLEDNNYNCGGASALLEKESRTI
ncbi:MAG: hypothetical protein CEO19_189 [Parcubacteria group bacterium Gr01-1014_73]|nr:MAG: hypothetical protein CEO19_189 [Parcubacteria group bacterium Gr01-1014_73]